MATERAKPGSVQITRMEIENFDGSKRQDIRLLIRELNVHESIMDPFVTATILIEDALSLTTVLPIVGQEKVHLTLKTPGDEFEKSIDLELRLVRIEKQTRVKSRSTVYLLRCVDHRAILNRTTRIRRAFMDQPISSMAMTIGQEYLDIQDFRWIDDTDLSRTIGIPNMTPVRAMSLLCREAKAVDYPSSNFQFFSNCDGFFFRTIDSMVQTVSGRNRFQDGFSYDTYFADDFSYMENQERENRPPQTQGEFFRTSKKPRDFLRMNSFSFENVFDHLEVSRQGAYESILRTLDPSLSLYREHNYSYHEKFREMGQISQFSSSPIVTEDFDMIDKGESRILFLLTNQEDPSAVDTDQRPDSLQLQIASRQLLNNNSVRIEIPGDSGRRCGDVVNIKFPEFGATDDIEGSVNRFVSGEYLVVSVRHIYNGESFSTLCHCVKNCYEKKIENFDTRRNA